MGFDKNKQKLSDLQGEESNRARLPKGKEFIGVVLKRLGGSRMYVKGVDSKEYLARVPGRVKKFLWIREGDIVLLEPWEIEPEKADLIYKYKGNEIRVLEKKGLLGNLEQIEEF